MGSDLIMVRTSERRAFKSCRWSWDFSFNQRIKPATAAPALRFGTLVHRSMEAYYRPGLKRGPKPAVTFQKLYAEELKEASSFGFRDEDGVWQEAGQLGTSMLESYHATYGKDDEWYVIATEQPFEVPVYRPEDLRQRGKLAGRPKPGAKPAFLYVGVLDGIRRHRPTNNIVLWDYKTAKAITVAHLVLDEQAGAYWTWGVDWLYKKRILKPGQQLDGIYFDFLRKAKLDTRPRNAAGLYLNQDGRVSKQQPPPYFHREPVWRDEATKQAQRVRVMAEFDDMQECRENPAKIYKNPSYMTCPGCGVRDICELHEAGQDYMALQDAVMKPWNPYDEHEIYEGR